MEVIAFLLVGAVAGWIAGEAMRGDGFGLIGNIVLGVVGSLIGGYLFSFLGIGTYGLIGSLISATIGAAILLWIASLFSARRHQTI
jgi:uncharacterized membrane protein YeaQ/YmgE (transglycosylase-associated protein family)